MGFRWPTERKVQRLKESCGALVLLAVVLLLLFYAPDTSKFLRKTRYNHFEEDPLDPNASVIVIESIEDLGETGSAVPRRPIPPTKEPGSSDGTTPSPDRWSKSDQAWNYTRFAFNLRDLPWSPVDQSKLSPPGKLLKTQFRGCDNGVEPRQFNASDTKRCRVRVLFTSSLNTAYDDPLCRLGKNLGHNRYEISIGKSMSHARADFVLGEALKHHPCAIQEDEIENLPSNVSVVAYMPLASFDINAVTASKALYETLKRNQTLIRMFYSGRVFAFFPAILFPPPFRFLFRGDNMNLNVLTHEVGTWGRRVVLSKKIKNFQTHYPRTTNLSTACARHTVLPKFDWDLFDPIPVPDTYDEWQVGRKQNMFLSARTSTPERMWFQKLSYFHPKDATFTDAGGFHQGMVNSKFCVDTTGDSLTTTRIVNAVLRGCIPLLICDDCVFPFSKLYRYRIVNSPEEAVEEIMGPPLHDEYPTFAVRVQQQEHRGGFIKYPMIAVNITRRLEQEPAVMNKLLDGVRKAQQVFRHPFAASSRFIDAMLDDMVLGASIKDLDMRARMDCPF